MDESEYISEERVRESGAFLHPTFEMSIPPSPPALSEGDEVTVKLRNGEAYRMKVEGVAEAGDETGLVIWGSATYATRL